MGFPLQKKQKTNKKTTLLFYILFRDMNI